MENSLPDIEKPKSKIQTPHRPKNSDLRPREHLFLEEVESLALAAKKLKHNSLRNRLIVWLLFRHGLRVSELLILQWDSIHWERATIFIKRAKNGIDATHPIEGKDLRLLRRWQQTQAPKSPFIISGSAGIPLTDEAVRAIIRRLGKDAGIEFPVHPHQLRHACGYYLAAKGTDTRAIQAYLGHSNIIHTARYTAIAPNRFKDFW